MDRQIANGLALMLEGLVADWPALLHEQPGLYSPQAIQRLTEASLTEEMAVGPQDPRERNFSVGAYLSAESPYPTVSYLLGQCAEHGVDAALRAFEESRA